MNITVIGTGYVCLVTGACLADPGNNVFCVDVDQAKIDLLNNGGVPIYEPGLKDVIERNVEAGRLTFPTDIAAHGSIQFIADGDPPDEDGSADPQYVLAAARNIGRHMTDFKVVDKSTVPVGTADKVTAAINAELALRYGELFVPPSILPDGLLRANGEESQSVPSSAQHQDPLVLISAQRISKHEAQVLAAPESLPRAFSVVSNPEFLKEGAALEDLTCPDSIVLGVASEAAGQKALTTMRQL